ncbi:hypothetical protein K466DRAFT_605774 [Polyporus arcularius HHB13444]|uniref:Uncharacterized protein n=1 Tax=Polyporus arcularius HHB13444 TaxID=1314778 RepID=A0A5C3NRN4_9APHY|nr:hypothetical protein K466DRAFT_605774 [Polyporus arcularius HHB13444]
MAPSSWATSDEWDWMTARNQESADATKRGRYTPWFNGVSHDYFSMYPTRKRLYGDREQLTPEEEVVLTEAIKTRRRQLANWFHNHRSPSRSARASPYATAAALRKGGRKRAPHAREVYCRLYYGDEQKAAVQEELEDAAKSLGRKLTCGETMKVTRAHIDMAFDEASEVVKYKVAARVVEEKGSLIAASRVDDLDREPTPEEYQAAIQAGPVVLQELLKPVVKAHGWVCSVIAAGPCPEEGGEIRSYAVHFGQNQSGHTLPEVMPDFREKYIKPMINFAKGVFPREVRDSRALRAFPEDMADAEPRSSNRPPTCRMVSITNALEAATLADSPPVTIRQPAATAPSAVQAAIPGSSSTQNAGSLSHTPMELDSSAVLIDAPMVDSFAPTSRTSDIPQQSTFHDVFDADLLYSADMYPVIGPGMGLGAQFVGTQFSGTHTDRAQYGGVQYGGAQYGNAHSGNAHYGNVQYGNAQYGNAQYGNAQYGGVALPGTASYGNMALGGLLDTLNAPLSNVNFDPITALVLPQPHLPTPPAASFTATSTDAAAPPTSATSTMAIEPMPAAALSTPTAALPTPVAALPMPAAALPMPAAAPPMPAAAPPTPTADDGVLEDVAPGGRPRRARRAPTQPDAQFASGSKAPTKATTQLKRKGLGKENRVPAQGSSRTRRR